MPTRYLKPGILDSEPINALSPRAENLFYRLLVNADDFGRFDARPVLIKSKCFPIKEEMTTEIVSELLAELVSNGLIIVYKSNDKPYLQMQKWDNQPRAKESKYPAPTGDYIQMYANANRLHTNLPETETETETETVNREPEPEPNPPANAVGARKETPKRKPARNPARPIAGDWQPSRSCLDLCNAAGIDDATALSLVPEFVLYWQETGEARPGFDATFLNHAKRNRDKPKRRDAKSLEERNIAAGLAFLGIDPQTHQPTTGGRVIDSTAELETE